jgi:outer membrane protein, multidrug efflux system
MNLLHSTQRPLAALVAVLTLVGCSGLRPTQPEPPSSQAPAAPAKWQAPTPAAQAAAGLALPAANPWPSLDAGVLPSLIAAAQLANPGLAAATARIELARAARVAAAGALSPQLDAVGALSQGRSVAKGPVTGTQSVGLMAGWELDLFGGRRAAADAASARLTDATLLWHALRTSVAAEVASTYVGLRACEAQLDTLRDDARSREQSSALTEQSLKAGMVAPANAALARASAAQGRTQVAQQHAACEGLVKALVSLTALEESFLRQQLNPGRARQPLPPAQQVRAVPADLLQQRADVLAASRQLEAAAFDVSARTAEQRPRVSLSGSIGAMRLEAGGITNSGATWSLGPLSVSIPLFDGGARRAQVQAARALYDSAVVQLQGQLRGAVREVEEALVQMNSVAERERDAEAAARDFESNFRAAESRWRGGVGSLFELEDARRVALAAKGALVELQRERATAWISLVRALGGGFSITDSGPARS